MTHHYPPDFLRGNGPLANLPRFQQAFSCPAQAPMLRPEAERREVW
ncbi:hypothetical protein LY474_40055 [Myxococcus stipitatus]|nr:hypothetical protein [Myxococcus stipitatus]MCE9674004.1 hypothetical protein [Myxococcus stipitatus]